MLSPTQKINNLSITNATPITPNYEICAVVWHIGIACQMMVIAEPTPDNDLCPIGKCIF